MSGFGVGYEIDTPNKKCYIFLFDKSSYKYMPRRDRNMRVKIPLLLLFIIATSVSCVKIEPGKVGVLTNNIWQRGVQPKPLDTGFRVVIPIAQQVDIYNTQARKYEMTKVSEEGETEEG